jgi:hypothetical protein
VIVALVGFPGFGQDEDLVEHLDRPDQAQAGR